MTTEAYQTIRTAAARTMGRADAMRNVFCPPFERGEWRTGPRAERREYVRAWTHARAQWARETAVTDVWTLPEARVA